MIVTAKHLLSLLRSKTGCLLIGSEAKLKLGWWRGFAPPFDKTPNERYAQYQEKHQATN